jgi:spore maturation protein CgeB
MNIAILGLSITSSWGNGHATTYRSLVRGLSARGHRVLFLERDVPWYASNRDLAAPPFCRTELYGSLEELKERFTREVRQADLTIVGSYVPEGVAVGEWVTRNSEGLSAFYDIDTPVTLRKLRRGDTEYLSAALVPRYDLYLSFTGGPVLKTLEQEFGARSARSLYCSVEPSMYFPENREPEWDLGYLGTYSPDRQEALEQLMLEPARRWSGGRMICAGPMYPEQIEWPANVVRVDHLAPCEHRRFYNTQRYTLNLTRGDMITAGYSPSVRLFEAAACGTPIISDWWPGLDKFFAIGEEILVARSGEEVLNYLWNRPEEERTIQALRARSRVLCHHTGEDRAMELESYVSSLTPSLPAR